MLPLPATIPLAMACGPAAAVDHSAPLGHAVPLGNLFWLAIYPYSPGLPNKVIVAARRDVRVRVEIRGFQCSTGKRLRFAYNESNTATTAAHFGPWRSGGMRGGYFLFSAPGNWKIVARARGRIVATAVVATWSE